MNTRTWIFNFFEKVNNSVKNNNELMIARTIMQNLDSIDNISLEQLANMSYVSQASVSRFVKKLGFDNYQAFRRELSLSYEQLRYRRELVSNDVVVEDAVESMNHKISSHFANMKIDIKAFKQLACRMIESHSVTFVGSAFCLEAFYTVQLDLVTCGKTCYLFKPEEEINQHLKYLEEDDLVVFLSAQGSHFMRYGRDYLEIVKAKNISTCLIRCRDINIDDQFDQVIVISEEDPLDLGKYDMLQGSYVLSQCILANKKDA